MSAKEKVACLTGIGLECGLLLLAFDRSGGVHDTQIDIVLLLATNLLYLAAVACVTRLHGGIRTPILLGWALVFRLTVFWMPPVFSDDLYRYRWEGRVAAAGLNPYDHRPAEPRMAPFFDERVEGKDFKPVYGPLLQTLQWAAALAGGGSLQAVKVTACLAELALSWLLFQWVTEKWRWLIWGWCPLAAVEFWGMGHNDAILMALALAALWFAERRGWFWAFVLLGLAAATKYWPLLLWPAFVRFGGWRWAGLTPAVFLLCWWPWHTNVHENARFLTGFVGGWRNNDAFFSTILTLSGSLEAAKLVSLTLILASALGSAFWARSVREAYWITVTTILLVSSNVHPWYLTWLLPLAVFHWPWPVIIWSALAPINYVALIRWRSEHEWVGVSNWRWAVYLPVFSALVVQLIRRRRVGNSRP